MIEELHKIWKIQKTHIVGDKFTGYESVYDQLNFTKDDYDADPEGTIDSVFNIYRSINLVPIVYFTEQGLVNAVKNFSHSKYNTVQSNVLGLGNNAGQTINRFFCARIMS